MRAEHGGTRGSTTWAPVESVSGTLIAFSTSPDRNASDGGFENHSIYTGALLEHLKGEKVSIEKFFKKVRQTVYSLSGEKQITWEHTSLIGDFYFDVDKMIYSGDIPYHESAVQDKNYDYSTTFGKLFKEMRSHNWYKQNAAISSLLNYGHSDLTKDEQFIFGRNLIQTNCGGSYSSAGFFKDLSDGLSKYQINGQNHVLNRILYEMYFNSSGEFRNENFKSNDYEYIFQLRMSTEYKTSFDFIEKLLTPYQDKLFYIPSISNSSITSIFHYP